MLWAVYHKYTTGTRFSFNWFATGPHWWSGQETGQVTSSTVRRGCLREIHWQWWRMGWVSLPSFGNYVRTTPTPHIPGMRMTLGREAPSRESVVTLITWWCEGLRATTSRSRPIASWLCLPGTYRRRRPYLWGAGFRLWRGAVTSGALLGQIPSRHIGWGENISVWRDSVATLAGVARRHP